MVLQNYQQICIIYAKYKFTLIFNLKIFVVIYILLHDLFCILFIILNK